MAIPVLLDCDPGHDDAFAIMLAATSPAIDLLGITTVAGNQTLPKTTLNARRVCTAAGIHGGGRQRHRRAHRALHPGRHRRRPAPGHRARP